MEMHFTRPLKCLLLDPRAEPQIHRGRAVQRQPLRNLDREREGGGGARQALHPRRQRKRHQKTAGRQTLPHRHLRQVLRSFVTNGKNDLD